MRTLLALLLALVSSLAFGQAAPRPSSVSASGVSTQPLTAPGITSTAASGDEAIIVTPGAKVCLDGPTCMSYVTSDGAIGATISSGVSLPGIYFSEASNSVWIGYSTDDSWLNVEAPLVNFSGAIQALTSIKASWFSSDATSVVLRGEKPNAASAIAAKVSNSVSLTTAGAEIVAFYSDAETTKKAAIDKDGSYRQVAAPTLQTCAAAKRYTVTVQAGGSAGKYDKQCLCVSDNQASPAYAWKNISGIFATEAASIGNTTTCPDP